MTDAMVCALALPGALAVAFLELKTGKAIAGGGIDNVDIDHVCPLFIEMLLQERAFIRRAGGVEDIVDLTISTGHQIHLLHPLNDGDGLCLYLALDRKKGSIPLGQRCIYDIEQRLQL